MKPPIILPSNDINDSKYIIIKIPRDSMRGGEADSIISDIVGERFKKKVWLALCLVSLILGIVMGSLFHASLFHQTPDKVVWKSSNLVSPDRK
jgi:hypothetical protein